MALEDALLHLVDAAEQAGWQRDEIWPALVSLVQNHVRADLANDRLEANLRTIRIQRLLFPDE